MRIRGELFILLAASSCLFAALDLNPAPWRTNPTGTEPTTYQSWDFATNANPSGPDVDLNPYGDALLTVNGGFFDKTVWYNTLTGYPGHQGIWGFELDIWVEVPNSSVANPYKEIWLQITYTASNAPNIFVVPEGEFSQYAFMNLEENTALDNGWYHAVYSIMVEPNPSYELNIIRPADCTLYVDDLIVETICAPEPVTLVLLGLGSAVLFKKRV